MQPNSLLVAQIRSIIYSMPQKCFERFELGGIESQGGGTKISPVSKISRDVLSVKNQKLLNEKFENAGISCSNPLHGSEATDFNLG